MESQTVRRIEDSKYFWSKEYLIAYYDVNLNMVLKPSALLNFLQDIATINAEMFGFGYSFTHPKNYGWFLVKYHMEFDDYPQDLNKILIKTEPRGVSKILANRDFEIWTSDNKKRLGRASSVWMMVDLGTKNVVNISKETNMPAFVRRENDLQFNKVIASEEFNLEKTFEIRYDDIDVNQHVNNGNYVVWAFETLPFQFRTSHKLKMLDIVYKKEIAFGHRVISQTQIEENISTHVLKNETTGEDLCFVNAVWE